MYCDEMAAIGVLSYAISLLCRVLYAVRGLSVSALLDEAPFMPVFRNYFRNGQRKPYSV